VQWENLRLAVYIILFVMFLKVYTEFKLCMLKTNDISYCANFKSK